MVGGGGGGRWELELLPLGLMEDPAAFVRHAVDAALRSRISAAAGHCGPGRALPDGDEGGGSCWGRNRRELARGNRRPAAGAMRLDK